MTGAKTEIYVDDHEIRLALAELEMTIGNMQPVFSEIGEYLLLSETQRFGAQVSPDGGPWAPLSPEYYAQKPKNKDKILTLEGDLKGDLDYNAYPRMLEFGTPFDYGAVQQFGSPEQHIPARPFLGLSDSDKDAILEIVAARLRAALTR